MFGAGHETPGADFKMGGVINDLPGGLEPTGRHKGGSEELTKIRGLEPITELSRSLPVLRQVLR